MSKATTAALHTLWQAAVASGGIVEIGKSLTTHSINVPGLEQGGVVVGIAVGGAALSLVKAGGAALAGKVVAKSKAARDTERAVAAIIAEYKAQHAATPDAATPAVPVLPPAGDS